VICWVVVGACLRCCVERLDERSISSVKIGEQRLSERLGDGLNERLRKRLGERLGKTLWKRLYEMLDPNMLQVYFREASRRIQESLNYKVLA
jgi:hypothetical protein